MALQLGFKRREVVKAIWKDDTALVGVTAEALEAWEQDGAAFHLEPFARNGSPRMFTYRPLRGNERRSFVKPGMSWSHMKYMCFQLGVRFPDAPEAEPINKDFVAPTLVPDDLGLGFKLLNPDFVDFLEEQSPGIVDMYGKLVYSAGVPTDAEKKASSPPSTERPSSAAIAPAASTAAATAVPSGQAGGAA